MGECNKYISAQARPELLVSRSTSFIRFSSCSRLSQIAIVRDHVWRLYQCVANVSVVPSRKKHGDYNIQESLQYSRNRQLFACAVMNWLKHVF